MQSVLVWKISQNEPLRDSQAPAYISQDRNLKTVI
jgi:hypothetical protein